MFPHLTHPCGAFVALGCVNLSIVERGALTLAVRVDALLLVP